MRKIFMILFCLLFLQTTTYSERVSWYIGSDWSYTEWYRRTNANWSELDNLSYKIMLFPLMYDGDYTIQLEEQVIQNIQDLENKISDAITEYENYSFDFRCSTSDAMLCNSEFNKWQKTLWLKLSDLISEYNLFREEYKALLHSKERLIKSESIINLWWNNLLNKTNSDLLLIDQHTVQIINWDRTYLLQTENICFWDETPWNKIENIQLLQSTWDRYIEPILTIKPNYTLNNTKLCDVKNYSDYLTPVVIKEETMVESIIVENKEIKKLISLFNEKFVAINKPSDEIVTKYLEILEKKKWKFWEKEEVATHIYNVLLKHLEQ